MTNTSKLLEIESYSRIIRRDIDKVAINAEILYDQPYTSYQFNTKCRDMRLKIKSARKHLALLEESTEELIHG